MGIFGAAHKWRAKRFPSLKLVAHINDETLHSYTLPKEGPKKI